METNHLMTKIHTTHHINKIPKLYKKRPPFSIVVLAVLLLSTLLTVLVAEQHQESRSNAQAEPIQQACLPDANLTKPEAAKMEPFCGQAPDAQICKDFCKRTSAPTGNSISALCQPGGVYHCEAAAGQPEKGKCQQGACTTSPRTGTDTYCGGGGTCCTPPQPLGGTCAKKEDCVAGLECTTNKCAAVAPKGPAEDLDGDGKQNDMDDDIDGDGIPNAQDPDVDNDGQPNAQDQQPNGAPGAPPAAPAPGGGGGAPAPGGGGAKPKPAATCASVKGSCRAKGSCTGTTRAGLCPGTSVCCIGGSAAPPPASACVKTGGQCENAKCCIGLTCVTTGGTVGRTCKGMKMNGAGCNTGAECISGKCQIWATGGNGRLQCGPIRAI